MDDLPSNLQEDREWLLAALEGRSVSWYDLPQNGKTKLKQLASFWRKSASNTGHESRIHFFATLPSLNGENCLGIVCPTI